MSKSMTFQEFGNLLKYVAANNAPGTSGALPSVKYLDPVFDMRTNSVFAITIRGFGFDDVSFHTQNECRELKESLEERIRAFLDTPVNA